VKLGLNLPNFGADATPHTLAAWASRAEEAGFDLLMVSDHIALVPEVQRGFAAPFYDPFTALAWLVAKTRTIELGTTVTILPYRHPLQTARSRPTSTRSAGGASRTALRADRAYATRLGARVRQPAAGRPATVFCPGAWPSDPCALDHGHGRRDHDSR